MKVPRVLEVDGFLLPPTFDAKLYHDAQKYVPDKGRVVIATYPKCGTTWTQQIVLLILRKGVPPADLTEYFSLLPFMEITPVRELENLPKDSCIKTHLPFDKITFSNDVKYIHVARHPADCVVSYYHHCQYFPIYFYSDGSFADFFEVFMSANIDYGDYFDHLLSWYEHKNEPNILFITFESLKADKKGTILKIAKFLGDEFYEDLLRDDERILKKVMEYSSIDYMRETVNMFWDTLCHYTVDDAKELDLVSRNFARLSTEAKKEGHFSIGSFIRKGGTGEGKITLSEEQMMRLESRMKKKLRQSNAMDLWKKN